MPEDLSDQAIAVDDLPDFSSQGVEDKRARLKAEQAEARKEIGPFTEYMAHGWEGPTPEMGAALSSPIGYRLRPYTPTGPQSPVVQGVREFGKTIADMPVGMVQPETLPMLPLAAVPVPGGPALGRILPKVMGGAATTLRHAIPKAMGLLFGGESLGAGAGDIVSGIEQGDPKLIGRGAGETVIGGTMVAHPVAQASKPLVLPRSLAALAKEPVAPVPETVKPVTEGVPQPEIQLRPPPGEPPTQEVPSAVQIPETTPVIRDVPQQPVIGQPAMPAQEGATRVPPGVEAPEAAGRSEVPLEVQQAADKWRRSEKEWRRAMRQGTPDERVEADLARAEAQGMFRDEAAKAKISQEAFDKLDDYARETETQPEAQPTEPAKPAAAAARAARAATDVQSVMQRTPLSRDAVAKEIMREFGLRNQRQAESMLDTPDSTLAVKRMFQEAYPPQHWRNLAQEFGGKPEDAYNAALAKAVDVLEQAKRALPPARAKESPAEAPKPAVPPEAKAAAPAEPEAPAAKPEAPKAAPEPAAPAQTPPADAPAIGEGPGAKTKGAAPYPAIQQLTDQLQATPKVGTKQGLKLGEKIADVWARKGDLTTKAIARMRNGTVAVGKWAEGIRRANDIDSRLGEYDYAIQYSTATSKAAGKAMERQMRDKVDREAAAILIDSARIATKDPSRPPDSPATVAEVRQVIKDALAILPKDTPRNVRLAMERALDPSLELRQFSEQLKQYFGIRAEDAIDADLFEAGLKDYYTHVWKKEDNMPSSLRNAIATGGVNTYFQFSRQRTIPSLIEGILEGKTPVLDPAKVVPYYNFTMDQAIASRKFIEALSKLKASDGRAAVDVRGGVESPDPIKPDSPLLIRPKTQKHSISDYKVVNHPAMHKWKWLDNIDGRDVLMRGDMVVHPEFFQQLSRFMDKDRAATRPGMRHALTIGAAAKFAKLGVLPSTFHIVHVGTHAAFHWTNPFRWKPIDFEAPATRFAIEKGHLKLAPSPGDLSMFAEGIQAPDLVKKVPYYGNFITAFSDFMFHQYIPRLKLNTFENAMNRSRSKWTATGRGLRAGRLTENDVAARIGDATNNAFGELNQLFLGKFGRSPEAKRWLRLIFLAPDFGEARLRFAAKGLSRYGTEERIALATMFGALYFGARLGNWLSHGDAEADDWRHAFEVKTKNPVTGKYHWLGMRSVIGDIGHAFERPGQFMYVRLSPAYSRPVTDFLFSRDERTGRKLSWSEKAVRIAQAFEPLPLGGLTQPDRTIYESLGQGMGLSNRRDMLVNDIGRKAHDWREAKGLVPVVEIIPTDEPSYLKLRTALNIGKMGDAEKILTGLLKTRTHKQIEKAMLNYLDHPYTGTMELEKQWIASMSKDDIELYRNAQKEKMATLLDFYKLLGANMRKKK